MSKCQSDAAVSLRNAIKEKKAEIENFKSEIKSATGNISQIVAAEKKERRAKAELDALETAYKAAAYIPPEPTDQEELLQGLKKYEIEYYSRIEKIKGEIAAADNNLSKIEKELQQAAMDADASATIELSDKKAEIEETSRYLTEMLQRAEEIPVYPQGVIQEEWKVICKRLLPEYENRLEEIRIHAKAYKAAADSVLQMQTVLINVREEMTRRANGEMLPTIFIKNKTAENLTIDKTYTARINNMFSPLTGQPI